MDNYSAITYFNFLFVALINLIWIIYTRLVIVKNKEKMSENEEMILSSLLYCSHIFIFGSSIWVVDKSVGLFLEFIILNFCFGLCTYFIFILCDLLKKKIKIIIKIIK